MSSDQLKYATKEVFELALRYATSMRQERDLPEARHARVNGWPDARVHKQGQGRDDSDDRAAGRVQEDVRQPACLNSSQASARHDDARLCGLCHARAAGQLSSRALPPPAGGVSLTSVLGEILVLRSGTCLSQCQ